MNRIYFTNTTLLYGSAMALVVTVYFIFVKGAAQNYIIQSIVILFLPGSISAYLSAHILYKVIVKRYKENKSTWLSGFYLIFLSFLLFGFIATLSSGIYEPYKAFRNIQSFIIMSFSLGVMAFIITCLLSVPLGYYIINKHICSNKQFNMDSGTDAPPPVN